MALEIEVVAGLAVIMVTAAIVTFIFDRLKQPLVLGYLIAGKVIGCGLGTRIMGYDASTSLKVGLGMAQIGEFAFIVVRSGQDANAVSSFLYPTIGVAVAITAFLTPYMIKLSYKIR